MGLSAQQIKPPADDERLDRLARLRLARRTQVRHPKTGRDQTTGYWGRGARSVASAGEARTPTLRVDAAVSLSPTRDPVKPPVYKTSFTDQPRTMANRFLELLEEDEDIGVRAVAADALTSISRAIVEAGIVPDSTSTPIPLDPETLVAAIDAALERDPANRMSPLAAFRRLHPMPMAAPPGLLETLKDPSSIIRGKALQSLSHFSSGVDPAVPVLLKNLQTDDRFPPDYLGAARLRPSPAVVPILIKSLASENRLVSEASAASWPELIRRREPRDLLWSRWLEKDGDRGGKHAAAKGVWSPARRGAEEVHWRGQELGRIRRRPVR